MALLALILPNSLTYRDDMSVVEWVQTRRRKRKKEEKLVKDSLLAWQTWTLYIQISDLKLFLNIAFLEYKYYTDVFIGFSERKVAFFKEF